MFLDEVGELPPPLQAKLLRVLETREVLRVGGVRARKIDVRFIAATNRDLEAEVSRGGFRRDLYFRLNGMTLTIPPLRERPRDLPILARGFVASAARAGWLPAVGRRRAPEISEAAMAVLRAHAWPGNVRELRNVIERALLLCDGPALLPEHLPQPVPFAVEAAAPAPATAGAPPPRRAGDRRARARARRAGRVRRQPEPRRAPARHLAQGADRAPRPLRRGAAAQAGRADDRPPEQRQRTASCRRAPRR